jgi:hypothetical protein
VTASLPFSFGVSAMMAVVFRAGLRIASLFLAAADRHL